MRVRVAWLLFLAQLVPLVGAELTEDFRSDFEETVLIDGLDSPTALDVAPDGSDLLLVTQQDGIIYAVSGSATAKGEADVEKWEIADLADLICYNVERGVVGISFHPDFAIGAAEGDESMWIYTFYTSNRNGRCATGKWVEKLPSPEGTTNVLSRFRIVYDSSGRIQLDMASEEILLETAVQPKYIHNGGDIAFGSDGLLYVTLGDGSTSKLRNDQGLPFQQALDVLFGKIVRLTPEGDIPDDNPYTPANGYDQAVFCGKSGGFSGSSNKPCAEIYSAGLRNPFRFAFDPENTAEDGEPRFFINDVGKSTFERILQGKRGANYGYPDVTGPCGDDCRDSGFEPAQHWYEHDSERGACISDGAFVPSNIGWPESFQGAYLYGEYQLGGIHRIAKNSAGCPECKTPTSDYEDTRVEFSDATATVSMAFGPYLGAPSKALYYLTRGAGPGSNEGGRPKGLVRISYLGTPQSNQRPVASISTDVTIGFNPLTVRFDGSESSDPDGEDGTLAFAWDLNGDGEIDLTSSSGQFVYNKPGTYDATLTVTDSLGATDKMSISIVVDDSPPKPIIESPSIAKFSVGDSIRLVGSATDAEDGALPETSLTWEIRENHGDHYHVVMGPKQGNDIEFILPGPVGYEAIASSYLEAVLTATDDRGLSSSAVKVIRPRILKMKLDSSPSGLDMMVYGQLVKTPTTIAAWENQVISVEAINDASGQYHFEQWSDGDSEPVHTVTASQLMPSHTMAYFGTSMDSTTSTSVADTELNASTGPSTANFKLLDFRVTIDLSTPETDSKRKLYSKYPIYGHLNKRLEDIVADWMRNVMRAFVKDSGMPFARPTNINLVRHWKKGHDDGTKYDVVYGGNVEFKIRKEGQILPSAAVVQEFQNEVLRTINLETYLVEEFPDAKILAVVTEPYEFAASSQGGTNNIMWVIIGICSAVVCIAAAIGFVVVRRAKLRSKAVKCEDSSPTAGNPDLTTRGDSTDDGDRSSTSEELSQQCQIP